MIDLNLTEVTEYVEAEYDNPDGSEWVVSVDNWGNVSVLKPPNIHWSFLEMHNAEEIGLPSESVDLPGVYKWTCNFWKSTDWESGHVDDYGFDIESSELLYEVKQ